MVIMYNYLNMALHTTKFVMVCERVASPCHEIITILYQWFLSICD